MERINLEYSIKNLPIETEKKEEKKERKDTMVIKRIGWKTVLLTTESNKEKPQKGMD